MKRKEEHLQLQLCDWLRYQYPNVIFTCDLASGMKMSIGQAVKAKRMRSFRGMPDMMIFEPRAQYHGLFLELKKEGTRIYKKGLRSSQLYDEHIREQNEVLKKYRERGYYAQFAVGFDEATRLIETYLSL